MLLSYQGGQGTYYDCDSASEEWSCWGAMGDLDRDSDRLKGFEVFHTDYDSYYINYLCRDMFDGMMKNEWFSIYTREAQPTNEVMD